MKTCLVCDDHALMREAIAGTLRLMWPSVSVTLTDNFQEARIYARQKFDMCISDLAMPGSTPIDGIGGILNEAPEMPLLVVTGSYDQAILKKLLGLGVKGFVSKTASIDQLKLAIRSVYSGQSFLPSELANLIAIETTRSYAPKVRLTGRQLDVLRLVSQGHSNKEIARQLSLAPSTVKTHLEQIMQALGASNRAEALFKATSIGLI